MYKYRYPIKIKASWGIIIGYGGIILFILSPNKLDFPAAIAGILALIVVQVVWPECRLRKGNQLCPLNLSQILFFIQIVLLPIIALFFGFSTGTLPGLPSYLAINIGLLVNTLAYLSFCGFYNYYSKKLYKSINGPSNLMKEKPIYLLNPMWAILSIYLIIGIIGFLLFYGDLNGYFNYIASPKYRIYLEDSIAGTIEGAMSTFFRPFLGFSIILAWSLWIDKYANSGKWHLAAFGTVISILVIVLINASYNRGVLIAPILAIFAVYSLRVRHLPSWFLTVIGYFLLGLTLLWGAYRSTDMVLGDLMIRENVYALISNLDIITQVQIYGAAPQFLGYLLEETGFGLNLYWGQTLLSSILYPIPVLGKLFRENSGFILYNMLIYGDPRIIDQIVPFQGELFINFHIVGVFMGYACLGLIVAKLQRSFDMAQNSFEACCWFLISLWTLFLIPGSLTVTSQMYIFFFWPIYIYFILKKSNLKLLQRFRAINRPKAERG